MGARQADWNNEDNFPFYERLGVEGLLSRARKCGLVDGADLRVLLPYLDANFPLPEEAHFLEIGAGYGRIANRLLSRYPKANVTLLETCAPSISHLRACFKKHFRVSILGQSLLRSEIAANHHVALWMWAGFLDFAASQKKEALRRVAKSLVPNGILAIEVPRTVGAEVKRVTEGDLSLDYLDTRWRGHVPTSDEISSLALSVGLSKVAELSYETDTNLQRTIHLFRRLEIH